MRINLNYFWSELLTDEFVKMGIKYACLSPGSRSTPLVMAIGQNTDIIKHVFVDERSSAFFALGLTKANNIPTIIVTTSGTAVAELYPAIIEAYYSKIPLIILTADRPKSARNCGSNQTINQEDIFKNHVQLTYNFSLPTASSKEVKEVFEKLNEINKLLTENPGPIHINLPFDEPLDPLNLETSVSDNFMVTLNKLTKNSSYDSKVKKDIAFKKSDTFKELVNIVNTTPKGLILVGQELPPNIYKEYIVELSEYLKIPVIADITSNLRIDKNHNGNIISNADALFRSSNVNWTITPDYIIQFGKTVTSKATLNFLNHRSSFYVTVDEYGDIYDPYLKAKEHFKTDPETFIAALQKAVSQNKEPNEVDNVKAIWLRTFQYAEHKIEEMKKDIILSNKFPNEARIANEVVNLIPDNSQLFISNSTPIRDFDYFASSIKKEIDIYYNRGASGIDGIISTTLGITLATKKPTVLVIGDQAFQHNLTALLDAIKYQIDLTIVLINNNGGGIFHTLPVTRFTNEFKEFFKVEEPQNYSEILKGMVGYHKLMMSWQQFRREFVASFERKGVSVLELQTDAAESLKIREVFWERVNNSVGAELYPKFKKLMNREEEKNTSDSE